jgi:hypothetical protein
MYSYRTYINRLVALTWVMFQSHRAGKITIVIIKEGRTKELERERGGDRQEELASNRNRKREREQQRGG